MYKILQLSVILTAFFSFSSTLEARKVCVDQKAVFSGQSDGSCWAKPYLDLEKALQAARDDNTIDAIWVADGVYRPSVTYSPKDGDGNPVLAGAMSLPENNPGITASGKLYSYPGKKSEYNERLKTFDLVDGVNIYGGFQGQSHPSGGESNLSQRSSDKSQYQTILDGNLGSNPEFKVWHVVTAGNDITKTGVNATLDRLVVRNGDAQGTYFPTNFFLEPDQVPIYYHDDGGGLYVFVKSNLVLKDLVIEGNSAIAGGGIFAHDGSNIVIEDSIISKNSARVGGGSHFRSGGPATGVGQERVTNVLINNSHFEKNSALEGDGLGGAIFFYENYDYPYFESNPELYGSKALIQNSQFIKNSAVQAGAVSLYEGSIDLKDNLFFKNEGGKKGLRDGALLIFPTFSSAMVISNNIFKSNLSESTHGVGRIFSGEFLVEGNRFEQNEAKQDAGSIDLRFCSNTKVNNNYFLSNNAKLGSGGGLFISTDCVPDVKNNHFIKNSAKLSGGAIQIRASTGGGIGENSGNLFFGNTPDDINDSL